LLAAVALAEERQRLAPDKFQLGLVEAEAVRALV
jgi:hypothetical protein